jgi:PAS domain S-box-containing protein
MSERLKATTVSRDEFLRERDFSDYVINSLPGVFYLFDTEGVFIRWNKNFEKITGYSADEIRKIKPFDLFEGEDRRLVAERIQDVFISGEASVEALFVSKNGSRTPYYFTGFRVIIEAKQFLIGVGIDISEKKKAEKEILEAQAELRRLLDAAEQSRMELARIVEEQKRTEKEIQRLNLELEDRVRARTAQLQAVNQELEAFAYSVSHDLRAPLRALDGFSAALYSSYSEKLDNQAKHYLERIKAASHRMGELINDLLNLSRITRCQMNFTEVDLSRLATKIASELQDGNPERHVRFVIKQGMTVRGDLHLLRIMLENLMNNSWKFTGTRSDATIEVGMSVDAGERAFFVKDNGVGFGMAYADKLFSPFQRLHGVKEFPGTGIGLVTVKRIVTRHGGRIWGEGSPDQGATFYFTLEV